MKRNWKICLWMIAALAVWFGSAIMLRASLSVQLTESENALLHDELCSFWDSDAAFYSDVLYDSQGTPLWMYGESEGGSVILNRVTQRFSEAGEQRYYADYHNVKKYYAAPLGHIIESKDVSNDLDDAEDGFFFMGPNRHLDSFSPGVIGWILSNLKLPAQALKSLLSGHTLPIK